MSSAKYPMLSSAVPLYNFLIDELEEYCDKANSSKDIVIAVKAGIKKLDRYYAKTDDTIMYTVATGKFNINLHIFSLINWTIISNISIV